MFGRKKFDSSGKIIVNKKVRLGVAFGGGGLRGIGHIGVIKAFEELGVKPDFTAGTSAGSIVGALYAAGFTSAQMLEEVKKLRVRDIKNSFFIWCPSDSENIESMLKKIFQKDLMFSELKIPFTVVATDIRKGIEVEIKGGSVAKACSGSSAVPGIFKPVEYEDMHLVDGGLKNNVPADVVRNMGANVVFAIDVNRGRGHGIESMKTLDVLRASLGMVMQANVQKRLEFADLLILPGLEMFSSSKIGDIDAMVQAGYDAVMSQKDLIVRYLTERPAFKITRLSRKLSRLKLNYKNKKHKNKVDE
ncbi:MAG: patatin-like phospholipase family protein [Clostridia bacterium]|nr:patatin-like phospholipase family protein [Clostridia bacterium]